MARHAKQPPPRCRRCRLVHNNMNLRDANREARQCPPGARRGRSWGVEPHGGKTQMQRAQFTTCVRAMNGDRGSRSRGLRRSTDRYMPIVDGGARRPQVSHRFKLTGHERLRGRWNAAGKGLHHGAALHRESGARSAPRSECVSGLHEAGRCQFSVRFPAGIIDANPEDSATRLGERRFCWPARG